MQHVQAIEKLAKTLGVEIPQVTGAVELFEEGNTVPFVARYRQEATGCLSETQLREVYFKLEEMERTKRKKEDMMEELKEAKVLTEAVKKELECAESEEALMEVYMPLKSEILSEGARAKKEGLAPLAVRIMEPGYSVGDVERLRGDKSVEEALKGARSILAEELMKLPSVKEAALRTLKDKGVLRTHMSEEARTLMQSDSCSIKKVYGRGLSKNAKDPKTYLNYYDQSFEVSKIFANRILAINRAERLGFLTVSLSWDVEGLAEEYKTALAQDYFHLTDASIVQARSPSGTSGNRTRLLQINAAVDVGAIQILKPNTERRLRMELSAQAARDAGTTFVYNLRDLLMAPPLVGVTVMGIDPGFRTGCKLCVCDPQGMLKATSVIYPHHFSVHRHNCARVEFVELVRRYGVEAIALGDGKGSRETEAFIYTALETAGLKVGWSLVSEEGVSIYSASDLAIEELPSLDVSLRGAVAIARRLQDPLAELVKVDPAHLGVGMYQHDIEESFLRDKLRGVVESVVNSVGVDVNTASPVLLSYVAGLSRSIANSIVEHRENHGSFVSRDELNQVDLIDSKVFRQCAGFLRIRKARNALDDTSVHPESYVVVHRLLNLFLPERMDEDNVSLEDLQALKHHLNQFREQQYQSSAIQDLAISVDVGLPTLMHIFEDIDCPGRDMRGKSATSSLKWAKSESIENLSVGDKLQGIVKNVVSYGAFVNLNVGLTGLIHVKQMPSHGSYWVNPHEVCKVGDEVSVEVTSLDLNQSRVSLKIVDHIIAIAVLGYGAGKEGIQNCEGTQVMLDMVLAMPKVMDVDTVSPSTAAALASKQHTLPNIGQSVLPQQLPIASSLFGTDLVKDVLSFDSIASTDSLRFDPSWQNFLRSIDATEFPYEETKAGPSIDRRPDRGRSNGMSGEIDENVDVMSSSGRDSDVMATAGEFREDTRIRGRKYAGQRIDKKVKKVHSFFSRNEPTEEYEIDQDSPYGSYGAPFNFRMIPTKEEVPLDDVATRRDKFSNLFDSNEFSSAGSSSIGAVRHSMSAAQSRPVAPRFGSFKSLSDLSHRSRKEGIRKAAGVHDDSKYRRSRSDKWIRV